MKYPPSAAQNGLFIGEGGGGVLLVWGDDYCDGFLAVQIFSKKRLKGLRTGMFVYFYEIKN